MAMELEKHESDWMAKIRDADSPDELMKIEKALFGRKKGIFTARMRVLRDMPSGDLKRKKGMELNSLKQKFDNAIRAKRSELLSNAMRVLDNDTLDVTMDLPGRERGHLHLVPEFVRQVEEVFGRMGFDVAYGPEIETEDNNFDLLNFPPDHPARDVQGTFWMKGGNRVLRTHTSPVQIRYAREHKPPFRMICPGKVYRKDADATHSPMFYQFEGLMVGEDISLCHLKGVMVSAMHELVSSDLDFRFRAGFFPFTEPSMEMDIKWRGDISQSREGEWLEVAGCGMVHPNVLRNMKINPKKWQGFAFGFGIDRLVMIKHHIPDIRVLYQGDLRFLRQF